MRAGRFRVVAGFGTVARICSACIGARPTWQVAMALALDIPVSASLDCRCCFRAELAVLGRDGGGIGPAARQQQGDTKRGANPANNACEKSMRHGNGFQ